MTGEGHGLPQQASKPLSQVQLSSTLQKMGRLHGMVWTRLLGCG